MNPECTVMLSPLLFRVDKSDPWISELSNGSGMWAADIGHSRGSRHFPPAGADYTLEGRNALHSTPASALLQQICASATITTTAHSATHQTAYINQLQPHIPATTPRLPPSRQPFHTTYRTRIKERRATSRRTHFSPNNTTPQPFQSPRANLWSYRRTSNLYLALTPLHFSSEVPELCDNLGHSSSRKCSRHHKSK
jgi:hypothetical protein